MKTDLGLNMMAYGILIQNYSECIDTLINMNYDIFGYKKNKNILSKFDSFVSKPTEKIISGMFDLFSDKALESIKNIDNLINIVINNNVDFNRKFLSVYNKTVKMYVPETNTHYLRDLTVNDTVYDKFLLMTELILLYHDKYISKTKYKNVALKNQIITITKLFEKHYSKKHTVIHTQQFIKFMLDNNINMHLLFYENLVNQLKVDNNH